MPDYLQLEPVAESRSTRKRTVGIILLVISVVLGLCAISAFIWWKQGEPSRLFYSSVGKMLQTPAVIKNYNLSSERDKGVLSAEIKTKYSDGNKESYISYKYAQQYLVGNSAQIDGVEGDIILNATGRMAKLSKYPESFSTGEYKKNQWYQARPGVSSFWEFYDPMNLIDASDINSGLVPSGVYGDDKVQGLITYMKENGIYTITKMDSTDKEYIYTVHTTDAKIAKLNTELSTRLGLSKPDSDRTYTDVERILSISISKVEGRVSRIYFEGTEDKIETLFTYPQDDTIDIPSVSNIIKVGV